jgi:hypothetical protein
MKKYLQLLLTSSSDGRVVLSCMASISSESHGHLDDDEEAKAPLEDGVIQVENKRYNFLLL